MPGDLRDHAILHETSVRLEELITACRRRGAIHGHAPNLAADVTRKAKALRTSLTGLLAALEAEADTVPEQPAKRKTRLLYRLYSDPLLAEMVRFVGHAGRNEIEFWDLFSDLAGRFSQQRASDAYEELCDIDKATLPATILLKPEVRAIAGSLLGESPEGKMIR